MSAREFIAELVRKFPGLADGDTDVNGADLTQWLTKELDRNRYLLPFPEASFHETEETEVIRWWGTGGYTPETVTRVGCPKCKGTDVLYLEAVEETRRVLGRKDEVLWIDGNTETCDDSAHDDRFYCGTCGFEWALPGDITQLEFA